MNKKLLPISLSFILLLTVLILYRVPDSHASPISNTEYINTLLSIRQDLTNSSAQALSVNISSNIQKLQEINEVTLPDGGTSAVNNNEIIADLRSVPPNMQDAIQRIDAIISDFGVDPNSGLPNGRPLTSGPAPTQKTWDDLNRLEQANFLSNFIYNIKQAIHDILTAIQNFLQNLFPGSSSSTGNSLSSEMIDILFIVFGLCLLGILLFIFIRFLKKRLLKRDELEIQQDEQFQRITDPQEAVQTAEELAKKGNYRDAIRYILLSSLLNLDKAGYLIYDPSLTNREYLPTIQLNSVIFPHMQTIVQIFDDTWYGHYPATEEKYLRCVQGMEEIKKASQRKASELSMSQGGAQ